MEATRTIGIQTGGGSSMGNYADNVIIAKNLLTSVASQNIAVVNSSNVQVIDNSMRAPGLANGPGVVPIDVEPNVGDRIVNVKIVNNLIDMTNTVIDASGAKGLHGIAINNLNQANPFTAVEVSKNTVYGANLKDPYNHISGGLILARAASNTLISNNISSPRNLLHLDRFGEFKTQSAGKSILLLWLRFVRANQDSGFVE